MMASIILLHIKRQDIFIILEGSVCLGMLRSGVMTNETLAHEQNFIKGSLLLVH